MKLISALPELVVSAAQCLVGFRYWLVHNLSGLGVDTLGKGRVILNGLLRSEIGNF